MSARPARARRGRRGLTSFLLLFATGCELQELTIAEGEPFVVVESYLVAGRSHQWAAIHGGGADSQLAEDAAVTLSGPNGSVRLDATDPHQCIFPGIRTDSLPGNFTCYATPPPASGGFIVRSGELYRLDVALRDGSTLSGATRVPAQVTFEPPVMFEPGGSTRVSPCYLPPWTQRRLVWQQTGGATAYVIDLLAFGLDDALAREGIEAEVDEPMMLRGLAVGSEDTTIVVPREVGLFDRFVLDPDLLIALQAGVPEGVQLDVFLAAVDRNYVNWARGGDFNPSGIVRVPSMRGTGGTGVFASLTVAVLILSTGDGDSGQPICGQPVD